MTPSPLRSALLAALAAGFGAGAGIGCSPRPSTPEACISAYSDAYRTKSARKILALTADPDRLPRKEGKGGKDAGEKREQWDPEAFRAETEKELKDEGMWYRAWCGTRFVSSREHDGHLHVTVDVVNARSEVVLVRQDGVLKVHPAPGSLD